MEVTSPPENTLLRVGYSEKEGQSIVIRITMRVSVGNMEAEEGM